MATGAYDSNGIWIFGEDDPAAPFSDLLNLGMESVSDEIANDRTRLDGLELLGARSTWTPTFTNATVGNGDVTAYWASIGGLAAWQWKWVFGSTSTISGVFASNLPTLVAGGSWMSVGYGYAARGTASTNRTTLMCRMTGSTTFNLWMDGNSVNATAPLGNWLAGDVISVGGVYFPA
ncbi:hypothetical protein [Jiangella muralis]|uniref:hypothetical protein n=1 Tax=Jiangella muralis TaxID=702383 RepID=UPI00069E9ECE|nr:hypothetical protein [Jiangella muralis]